MSYLGFARKYRPQTFEEVAGQQEITSTLQNAVRNDRVHHAYIFAGSKGVGKTSMARIFSKALNCEKGPGPTPCNQCELCLRISTGEDIDVVEIDGASNRGIEEIRNIKENIKYLTSRARYKIFIIDEVHMLTPPAFNALLKTLEEPPAHVKFILATTEITSIPDTILSRCQRFQFKKIVLEDIVRQLQKIAQAEQITLDKNCAESIARTANGAMRDSVVLFDQLMAFSDGEITEEKLVDFLGNFGEESVVMIDAIAARDANALLQAIEKFFDRGGDPNQLIAKMLQSYRDILVLSMTGKQDQFVEGNEEYCQWAQQISKKFSPEFSTMVIHHLLEAKQLIYRSLMGRIVLEMVLLKLLRLENLLPLTKIQKNLQQLERKLESRPQSSQRMPQTVSQTMPVSAPMPAPQKESVPQSVLFGMESPGATKKPQQKPLPQESRPISTKPAQQKETPLPPPKNDREAWERFISDLASEFPQAAELLRKEAKVDIQPHGLMITLPQEYHIVTSLLNTPKNKPLVNKLIQRNFQKDIPFQFQFQGATKNIQSKKEIAKNIDQDVVMVKAMELFDGRLIDSYPIKKDEEKNE